MKTKCCFAIKMKFCRVCEGHRFDVIFRASLRFRS